MATISGMRLFSVQLTLLIICLLITGLRTYVKACMARRLASEDWFILLAMTTFAVSISIAMRGATFGAFGQSRSTAASPQRAVASLEGIYFCELLYAPTTLAVRTSICLFLLKIVRLKVHKRFIYGLLVVVSAAAAAYWLITLLQCFPPSFFWDQARPDSKGRCIDPEVLLLAGYIYGSISALSDVVVGTLPILILWQTRLDLRTKLAVVGLLGMSIFASVAVIIRMTTLSSIATQSQQFFRLTMNTALWSIIEPAVGIVAASLPTLRPLVKKLQLRCRVSRPSTPRIVLTGHRSRPLHLMPHWLELKTRNTSDGARAELGMAPKMPASSIPREWTSCNVAVDQSRFLETPVPGAITVHTAIEVMTRARRSSDASQCQSTGWRRSQVPEGHIAVL
ncbi:integral membrane protein [Ophiocordyceps camponoti-floridani]|uniref:Integral membrane protein n=1 Tax=Ophiocordyceps camponoti-floridani TaxID=2030778 RepID=A0A8H4Q0S9_9HYPO|nr:integral membrane protein [Ophiocordyceps camponoti-floridani]